MNKPIGILLGWLVIVAAGAATAGTCDLKAGPLWSQADASTRCPVICGGYGGWTGAWQSTGGGRESTCTCQNCDGGGGGGDGTVILDVPAGTAVFGNAQHACTQVCQQVEGAWTGDHSQGGPTSATCACRVANAEVIRVPSGTPIISDLGAGQVCPRICQAMGRTWNGTFWNEGVNGRCGCKRL